MTDSVKLSCTFGAETVLSPVLDLYTCNSNIFSALLYPPNIILNMNDPGDISYNIDSYFYSLETKTKCYWDQV